MACLGLDGVGLEGGGFGGEGHGVERGCGEGEEGEDGGLKLHGGFGWRFA